LVLATYQVQGEKMPRVLAAIIIYSLLAVSAIAVLSIVWECVKEFRVWRERRETSTAWIDAEPPGHLDFIPDMQRASKKFIEQLNELNTDTARVGRKMRRHTRVSPLMRFASSRMRQRWANSAARSVTRSAVFIEKRQDHLRATVGELKRVTEAQVASAAPETEADRAALLEFRRVIVSRNVSTLEAVASVEGYRDVALGLSEQNLSRTLRVSNKRLSEALDGIIRTLRGFVRDGERLEAALALKAKP
jgi:hypothetical protein